MKCTNSEKFCSESLPRLADVCGHSQGFDMRMTTRQGAAFTL